MVTSRCEQVHEGNLSRETSRVSHFCHVSFCGLNEEYGETHHSLSVLSIHCWYYHVSLSLYSDGMLLMKDLRRQLQSGLPNEDVRTNVALNLEGIWCVAFSANQEDPFRKEHDWRLIFYAYLLPHGRDERIRIETHTHIYHFISWYSIQALQTRESLFTFVWNNPKQLHTNKRTFSHTPRHVRDGNQGEEC